MNNKWSLSILFWVLALILADRLNAKETANYTVKRQIVDGLPKCPAGYGDTCYKKVVEHQIRWEEISQEDGVVVLKPTPANIGKNMGNSIKDKLKRRFRNGNSIRF